MKRVHYFVFIVCFFLIHQSHAQEGLSIDKIWNSWELISSSPKGFNFLPGSDNYTRVIDNAIKVYDIKKDIEISTLYDGKSDGIAIGDFQVLDDNNLLIMSDVESIYRRSKKAKVHFYNAAKKKIYTVANGQKVMYASVDPTADRVAYVLNNDIYVEDLSSGQEEKVTNDGKKNKVINGASDWVYEEEFYITKTYEWSPDGRYIAYLKFDESQVPEYELQTYNYDEEYPEIYKYKYPKVGEKNSIVTVHIYNTEKQRLRDVDLGEAYYIPRIQWNHAGNLVVTTMNRHQNELNLLMIHPLRARIDTLLHETEKTYINVNDVFRYIDDGEKFLWQSERNGWKQLFLYDKNGELLKTLTDKGEEVTDFYGYDSARGEVLYQLATEEGLGRQIYAVNVESGKRRVVESQIGVNSATFSPTFDYYSHTFQTINSAPVYSLKNNEGKVLKRLEDNDKMKVAQEKYQTGKIEFLKLKSGGLDSLHAWMLLPKGFDSEKEYPVLMYVYGGPGAQTVINSWGGSNYWWFQLLAEKGVVVVSVDNRGSGGRGSAFEKQTYLNLGKMETEDQISAAKQLAEMPFIDADRIGIFGWSYGGFMAANCILKGNDIFNLAIAIAPVTHWKWYDTIYTERYMRTMGENKAGYDNNSPINFVDRLQGNFLLAHGMLDDNVHFQHSIVLSELLIRAGKQFDTYYYPQSNHGIYAPGARFHLYTKMTDFIIEKYELED